MSMYSVELRTLIHECLLINTAQRPTASEVVQRTQNAIDLERMSMGGVLHATSTPYSEPQLSARWYSGQVPRFPAANPPPLTPVKATVADKLHDAQIAIEKEQLKRGKSEARTSNAQPPAPGPPAAPVATLAAVAVVAAVASVAPKTPTPPPAPPAATTPATGSGAAVKPAVNAPIAPPPVRPLPSAIPSVLANVTQVICIVQIKTFFGNFQFKNYTIKRLTPDTIVMDAKSRLMEAGCGITYDKQVWMNGRLLMSDFMKLGEFANLADGNGTVRVTPR